MTRRDLVKAAIQHRVTPRCPYLIDLCGETIDQVKAHTGCADVGVWLDNDVMDIGVPWWAWDKLGADWRGPETPTSPVSVIGTGSYEKLADRVKELRERSDTQQTLPFGTPDEVRAEARRVRDLLSAGGGYIFAPAQSIQGDVPPANIEALIEVAREERYQQADPVRGSIPPEPVEKRRCTDCGGQGPDPRLLGNRFQLPRSARPGRGWHGCCLPSIGCRCCDTRPAGNSDTMQHTTRLTDLRWLALLAVLSVAGTVGRAPAAPLSTVDATAVLFDRNNRDLQLVDDRECMSGKALELRFKGKSVAFGALPVLTSPLTGTLTSGLYRVTVRMKMQGMLHSLGTGITLGACGWNPESRQVSACFASRTLYLNEFVAEDAWQEFTFDFDHHPGDLARRRLDVAAADALLMRHAEVTRLPVERRQALRQWILDHPYQVLPLQDAPAGLDARVVHELNAHGATPTHVAITVTIPQNRPGYTGGTRGNSTPYPSLRRLYLDVVRIERLPEPAVLVRDVRARKAWLRPGELQQFEIDLHNRSGAAQSGKLALTVESGLGLRTPLPGVAFALPDGAYTSVIVDWSVPASHPLWGQTFSAAAEVGGQAVSAWRTWFTVHPRNVAVMIPWSEGYAEIEAGRFCHPTASKPNVANLYEFWAPTPYDAAGLVPEDLEQPFMAGNSGKVESLVTQAEKAAALHERGIGALFYCEAHGTGLKAWDLYWDHPEWCAPSEPTSDLFYQKRRDAWPAVRTWYLQSEGRSKQGRGLPLSADEQAALEQPAVEKLPDIAHVGFVTLNGLFPEVVDSIIRGHIALMERVPYVGCRWDSAKPLACLNTDALGRDLGRTPAELDELTVQNLARYFREIRARHPGFEVGFNYGHSALMGKRDEPFDFEAAARVLDDDPVCRAILADGGYILEESWGHSFEMWNDYKIVARNYLRACRAESAAYKQAGGHHGHMFRDNGVAYTPDDIYQQLFSLLGGAHLTLVNYGPIPESSYDLGVYAARFAEFFWDPKLRQLTHLDEKVQVETDADIWASEAGFEKDTDAGTRLYVLPLINPPVTERWLKNRYGLLPAPIRQPLAVTVAVPQGFSSVKAVFSLENNPWPEVVPLKFEADDREVRFEFPELVTFKVAVVEFAK